MSVLNSQEIIGQGQLRTAAEDRRFKTKLESFAFCKPCSGDRIITVLVSLGHLINLVELKRFR